MKINLKKKSHVKGYALRGAGLRKQVTLRCALHVFFFLSYGFYTSLFLGWRTQMYMQKFQLKGERFGGGGGYFGRGRRGGFRGSLSRQGDTCYKCGATGHWAINCPGRGETAGWSPDAHSRQTSPMSMAVPVFSLHMLTGFKSCIYILNNSCNNDAASWCRRHTLCTQCLSYERHAFLLNAFGH